MTSPEPAPASLCSCHCNFASAPIYKRKWDKIKLKVPAAPVWSLNTSYNNIFPPLRLILRNYHQPVFRFAHLPGNSWDVLRVASLSSLMVGNRPGMVTGEGQVPGPRWPSTDIHLSLIAQPRPSGLIRKSRLVFTQQADPDPVAQSVSRPGCTSEGGKALQKKRQAFFCFIDQVPTKVVWWCRL